MASATPSGRILSIDLLRGIAVLLMVETHAVGLLLRPELRATLAFDLLDLFNGLVAPAFLFVAGFAFVLATRRLFATGRPDRQLLHKLGWRIAGLWLLGYLLRLPAFTLGGLREASAADWQGFIAADVLHCIAAGWVLLLAARLFFRTDRALGRAYVGLTAGVLAAAPGLWGLDVLALLPPPLAAYVNAQGGSLFPLFPWFAFMAAGAAFGLYHRAAQAAGQAPRFFRTAGWTGLGLATIAFAVLYVALPVMPMGWAVNPIGLLMRFGLVLASLGVMHAWSQAVVPGTATFGAAVLQMGRQSLPVYAAHLLLLYRAPWGQTTFPSRWGGTLDFGGTFAWVVVLIAMMAVLAYQWPRMKAYIQPRPALPRRTYRPLVGLGVMMVVVLLSALI